MHRNAVARPDAGKSGLGMYRVGQFVIRRVGSRWRIHAQHFDYETEFSTLGGAAAWCSAAVRTEDAPKLEDPAVGRHPIDRRAQGAEGRIPHISVGRC
jgi:hypothetical protein